MPVTSPLPPLALAQAYDRVLLHKVELETWVVSERNFKSQPLHEAPRRALATIANLASSLSPLYVDIRCSKIPQKQEEKASHWYSENVMSFQSSSPLFFLRRKIKNSTFSLKSKSFQTRLIYITTLSLAVSSNEYFFALSIRISVNACWHALFIHATFVLTLKACSSLS